MTSSGGRAQTLPPGVSALLDGTSLATKVGETILVIAADAEGWPRMALLSVGEVLAAPPSGLDLAMYPGSRTTRALLNAGRGLVVVVADGTTYKIEVAVERVASEAPLALLRGEVVGVDEDRVGYARTLSGVRYELDDAASVVRRWERQIEELRAVRQ